jgi:tRNA pseudouridine38-40 synthase
MFIYQMLIEYDGTNYNGWQKQKNGKSIQETVEKVLKKILKNKINLYGSGRTDAGVHAISQSAHFSIDFKINNKISFLNSINFFLKNKKISILDVKLKPRNFHARFSAKNRIYEYVLINRQAPLSLENKAWHVKRPLNIDLMKKGAKLLLGTKDFSTFRSASCGAKSPIRTLKIAKVYKSNNKKIIFIFESKSFLQQQVRSMVGCLKYLGEQKWNLKKFKRALKLKDRSLCAPPAPPGGLFLKKITY